MKTSTQYTDWEDPVDAIGLKLGSGMVNFFLGVSSDLQIASIASQYPRVVLILCIFPTFSPLVNTSAISGWSTAMWHHFKSGSP